MSHKEYLSADCVLSMETRFVTDVPRILGRDLVFAFIFGGVAKGYANHHHDIDIFFCINESTEGAVLRCLQDWYFELHECYRMPPDVSYPGETVAPRILDEKIRFLEGRHLRLLIETQYEYEAILWGDALSGPKCGKTGNLKALLDFECRCARLAQRWREEIRSLTVGKQNQSDCGIDTLDLRRLFKWAGLEYLKLGNNTRPPD